MMSISPTRQQGWRTPTRVLVAALIVISACSSEKTYEVQGRVAGFGDDHHTVIVEHGEIQGLMPAMTMPFTARDSSAVSALRTGDAVTFNLYLHGDSSWISDIEKLPNDAISEHPASRRDDSGSPPSPILQAGDAVPDTQLRTHADSLLNLSELKGRAVVITFIYTRCPLPDYCPRMTRKFVQLQEELQSEVDRPARLLSVSLDPNYDTPDVLTEYARREGADLSTWTFATGDSIAVRTLAQQFGVFYQPEGGDLIHNLSTALIGPEGRIQRIWRGNDWTVDEVTSALRNVPLL